MPIDIASETKRLKAYNLFYPLIESIIFQMKYHLHHRDAHIRIITNALMEKYPTEDLFYKNQENIRSEIIQKLDEALKKQFEEEKRIAEQSKTPLPENTLHIIADELKRIIVENKFNFFSQEKKQAMQQKREIIGEIARKCPEPSKVSRNEFLKTVCNELYLGRERIFARRQRNEKTNNQDNSINVATSKL
jgi:hypothetical protein